MAAVMYRDTLVSLLYVDDTIVLQGGGESRRIDAEAVVDGYLENGTEVTLTLFERGGGTVGGAPRTSRAERISFDSEHAAVAALATIKGMAERVCPLTPGCSHVHMIVNPCSGGGRGQVIAALTERVLGFHGIGSTRATTAREGHAVDLASEGPPPPPSTTSRDPCSTIICVVGGDGTIHEVVNGLAQRTPPLATPPHLAVIPAGAGNGLLATLGVVSVEDAIHTLVRGRFTPLDVLECAFEGGAGDGAKSPSLRRFAVCSASYGLLSAVEFESMWLRRVVGSVGFQLTGFLKVACYPKYRATMRITLAAEAADTRLSQTAAPTRPFEPRPPEAGARVLDFDAQDYAVVTISNTAQISAGSVANPSARVADGAIDVCIVRRRHASRLTLIDYFDRLEAGTLAAAPYVECFKASEVTFTPVAPLPACARVSLDGEPVPGGGFVVRCCPGSLRMLAPMVRDSFDDDL